MDDRQAPVLAVTRGRPTTGELAAVVAVLLAVQAAATTAQPTLPVRRPAWAHGSRLPRPLPAPGPGSWRTSAQPG